MIATLGGGLCQLSNALYDVALQAGFEIVERHAHTQVIAGSRAQLGRDATVFWNYVDLRFKSAQPFRIEARMTASELEVVIRAISTHGSKSELADTIDAWKILANDCTTCRQISCHRHHPERPVDTSLPSAWLVDAVTPEFAAYFAKAAAPQDWLFLPTRRFGRQRYGWPARPAQEITADLATLRRSFSLRKAAPGAEYQMLSLQADARLAEAYARRLSYLCTHLVIAQNLLPHLWQLGALQGRSFDVLMERLPIKELHGRLDQALALHPDSPTLNDFRASQPIVDAEEAALAYASQIVTPHRGIAALFPSKARLLDWQPRALPSLRHGGRAILFPSSALARKGAYELRDAIRGLDVELLIRGSSVEHAGFWDGLAIRQIKPADNIGALAVVVLPAFIEHKPQALLGALAAGIPVIASDACGLMPQAGLTIIPAGNAEVLRDALLQTLSTASCTNGKVAAAANYRPTDSGYDTAEALEWAEK